MKEKSWKTSTAKLKIGKGPGTGIGLPGTGLWPEGVGR